MLTFILSASCGFHLGESTCSQTCRLTQLEGSKNVCMAGTHGPAQERAGLQNSAGLTRMLPSGRTMSQLVEP